jgi:hypothetical protein
MLDKLPACAHSAERDWMRQCVKYDQSKYQVNQTIKLLHIVKHTAVTLAIYTVLVLG